MDVLLQLACNTGYSVLVNYKVLTTAAGSNKQGDVELLNFGLMALTILSLMFQSAVTTSVIAQSTTDTSMATYKPMTISRNVLGSQTGKYKADYAVFDTAFAPAIVSVAGQIHSEFLCLCGSWLTNTRAFTVRSSAQRSRLAARLSRGVK